MTDEAAHRGESVGLAWPVHIGPGRTAAAHRAAVYRVHFDLPHATEINHQPVVADRRAGEVVPAATHRDFKSVVSRKPDGLRNILDGRTTYHQGRSAVDGAVPYQARRIVVPVCRRD